MSNAEQDMILMSNEFKQLKRMRFITDGLLCGQAVVCYALWRQQLMNGAIRSMNGTDYLFLSVFIGLFVDLLAYLILERMNSYLVKNDILRIPPHA